MSFIKKAFGGLAGGLVGGAVGGPVGAALGGIAGSALGSGGDIDFSTLAIGGLTGFAANDFAIGQGLYAGTTGAVAGTAATAGTTATAAGAASNSSHGLLARTLGSDWWKSPTTGAVLSSVGGALLSPDPYDIARYQQKLARQSREERAENYRRPKKAA